VEFRVLTNRGLTIIIQSNNQMINQGAKGDRTEAETNSSYESGAEIPRRAKTTLRK
jgi:hypothetical protein